MRENQSFNNPGTSSDAQKKRFSDFLHRIQAQNMVSQSHDEEDEMSKSEWLDQEPLVSSMPGCNRKKTEEQAKKHRDNERVRRREHAIIRALLHDCYTEEDVVKHLVPNQHKRTLSTISNSDGEIIAGGIIRENLRKDIYARHLMSQIDQLVEYARSLGIKDVHSVRPRYSDSQIHKGFAELTSRAINFDKA